MGRSVVLVLLALAVVAAAHKAPDEMTSQDLSDYFKAHGVEVSPEDIDQVLEKIQTRARRPVLQRDPRVLVVRARPASMAR